MGTLFDISVLAGVFYLIFKQEQFNKKTMASFEEFQNVLSESKQDLENVKADVASLADKVTQLEEQIGNMGLTAEQEATIFAGLTELKDEIKVIADTTPEEELPVEPDPINPEEPSEDEVEL